MVLSLVVSISAPPSAIGVTFLFSNLIDNNAFVGFVLEFPFGETNEDSVAAYRQVSSRWFLAQIENGSAALRLRFPAAKSHLALVEVSLQDDTNVEVELMASRFAMPNILAINISTTTSPLSTDTVACFFDMYNCRVIDRYDMGRSDTEKEPYKLIVHGYKDRDEYAAFLRLLQLPGEGDKAAPRILSSGLSQKLNLTARHGSYFC
ncbi:hypothetical protein TOPH_02725 [Tolypocladium ophioglossoides CBS 100239]|uniref:Uncharacterized protein n=1 Tax=Tolypocladium ophioglossoides (strain CBS 100239) TaxID=1163406 RepID=A0A0L0NG14_TOLOC|nr:hypothetical protein TOPH_02725 [Tolypocladium ophioglossoides CBS 100239]